MEIGGGLRLPHPADAGFFIACNPRLLQRIAAETNVAIGGRLYSDALSEADGPAGTYLNMMQHNIGSLITALNSP